MQVPDLSLVIPVFNEEPVIPELARRLADFLSRIDATWEVVFVDDGSKDRSRELLAELCRTEPRYKLIGLSRNFGHQLAITAGMDYAAGGAVVVMDADLQDPPEVVEEMLARYREGYDVVYAVRRRRENEGVFKRGTAALFYRLLRSMVGVQIPLDAGDFRLMSRRVVIALASLREAHRFVRGMVAWVGFRQTAVHYDRPARFAGETHYPLRKMIKFAIDGITSFSAVPLKLATYLGLLSGLIGFATAVWALWEKLSGQFTVPGWTTIMVAVCFASAAQLLMIGILGEYVGRIYDEVKRRPLYFVGESVNVAPSAERLVAPEATAIQMSDEDPTVANVPKAS
jgi:dolichol-phosphate mannosyltransferase